MLFVGDARIPEIAKEKLARLGTFVPFQTSGITYEAISGHPDIFFCYSGDLLVAAPNTPAKYLQILKEHNIHFEKGTLPVGSKYPETARYNASVSDDYLIHNIHISDESLKRVFNNRMRIFISQGYARCSMVPMKNGAFITSDAGIYRTLKNTEVKIDYFSPKGILLPGFKYGFLGGTMGLFEDKAYLLGALKFYPEGDTLGEVLTKAGYEIIELYQGLLFDGGSLMIFP
ncbi:MAG: hypothetical protein IH595_00415 [Bacteroidales bacterium]|nr:hypothetical protein [Bacteroidales bacterium]